MISIVPKIVRTRTAYLRKEGAKPCSIVKDMLMEVDYDRSPIALN